MSEQEIFGKAQWIGTTEIAIKPLIPQLLDNTNFSVRQNLKFMRNNATVGLAMMSLKFAGEFVTKFDGPADHIPGGPR